MPRPTNKEQLLAAADEQYGRLQKLIGGMSDVERNAAFAFEDRDKNLRDVLAHLHEWHCMVERWHRIGTLEGGMPDVPGKGYTWKTLPDLNLVIWESCQKMSLEEAIRLLDGSHKKILALINAHSDNELFERSVYRWTKSTTLGAYFVSGTSSHYDWAVKKLKKHIKLCREV